MSGLLRPAAGLEAGVRELVAQQLQRHAVLQRDGDGAGKAVHQAADGGAFLGHGDEDLARLSVGIDAHGDVAFVSGDVELVGDGEALVGQAVADGARRLGGLVDRLCRPVLLARRRQAGYADVTLSDFAVAVPTELSGCAFLQPSR